jgi:anhydro-N-acetylmuramic acid kinase
MSRKASLKDLLTLKSKYIIGLNSGTSADGIDAALIKIEGSGECGKIQFVQGATYAYAPSFKAKIKRCAELDFDSARAWLELDCELAGLFAKAALKLIKSSGLKLSKIALIGSHGHTIRHLPYTKYGSITYQIADPARIAVVTGITTVGDFRVADTAVGGQGAPLTPIVNGIIFGKLPGISGVLNIGGIANISVIEKKSGKLKIFGCDTGPGNMAIDHLARKLYGRDFDKGGKLASQGLPHWGILSDLLGESFFNRKGPKSAGREEFGAKYAERFYQICKKRNLSKPDIMATATMLTAIAVKRCADINRLRFDRLILTGGGAKNHYLVKGLKDIFIPAECVMVDSLGYPGDYLEAISFAVLANEAVNSNRHVLSGVTGAKKAVVLGKVCQP